MSLQVLNAHTGHRLSTDPANFRSLDAFKSWLADAAAVPSGQQILLTSAGKQARYPAILAESEVFLYNRQLVSSGSNQSHDSLVGPVFDPATSQPGPPPDILSDQNDLKAWQRLFESRRDWAREILQNSRSIAKIAHDHFDAITIIERGVGVAAGNLQSHVKTLEQKYVEARAWSQQAVRDQAALLADYPRFSHRLDHLPANEAFIHFVPKLQAHVVKAGRDQSTNITLAAFVDQKSIDDARAATQQATKWISDRTNQLGMVVNQVARDSHKLVTAVERGQAETLNASGEAVLQLLEDIEVLAKKIESDYEHVAELPLVSKSLAQASKLALIHTRSYLPELKEFCHEMSDTARQSVHQRNAAALLGISNMQKIATLESTFAQVNSQVVGLDLPTDGAEGIDRLSLLSQLPFVYGALLIEAVRRREWSDRLRTESATIAEDIAGYREEEERRRKKWFKNLGPLVNEEPALGTALNFELNLQTEQQTWPEATRDDVSQYLEALEKLVGVDDILEELSEMTRDLKRPSKRQLKKAKGFKMGSIHQSESGRGSFLLRNDEELRIMKDLNQRLEEELLSQKSRVRKLEDLVYKHAQTGRSVSGNIFRTPNSQVPESPGSLAGPPFSALACSPKANDLLSRKASVNSRRASTNSSADEKALAQRIVTLEAELYDEKQKRKELQAAAESKSSEFEEAHATKRDLMANMDAQQQEFANERRLLKAEVDKYKVKIEEFEDELDRLLGSRDIEKSGFDEKLQTLEMECKDAQQALESFQAEQREREEVQADQAKILRLVHVNLAPDRPVPGNLPELVHGLDELAERSAREVKELGYTLLTVKNDKNALQCYMDKHEEDIASTRKKIESLEDEAASLRSDAATQKARAGSLAVELDDGRNQLRTLRAKFAEGETGSEALRQRVEEQAAKASALSTQLAESKSQVYSLDMELLKLQHKQHELEHEVANSGKRLEQRSARDRELTHRLAACNTELIHLLDALGLSIVERDGVMAIQRTSKLAGASTTLIDPTQPTTSPPALGQPFDVSIDPGLLLWMQAATAEEEIQLFQILLSQIDAFNMNKFSEAIIKLRRDVEWTGKKWKAEARVYRDKYHRIQGDAHDKIAFRSFREGDLALFLPTRNQATRPWAAFNVGAPHYFLREQDSHKLQNREWLVARISKLEERVVDLSKSMEGRAASIGDTSESGTSLEDDNPFELSDGLRWYLLDAAEEKAGAPSTPGLGKTTVASAIVDAKGSIRMKRLPSGHDASTKLNKSLESRRSSTTSKRGSISGASIKDGTSEAIAIARAPSLTQLRPGSHSSTTAPLGPSSLGVEVSRGIEEHLLTKSPAISKPLLSLFGATSPSKSSSSRSVARSLSSQAGVPVGISPSKVASQVMSPEGQESPVKTSARSNSSSPSKGKQIAWEPLWSMDVSIEGGQSKQ